MSTTTAPTAEESTALPPWPLMVWLAPALVFALYYPTLEGSFLADDFLLNTMLTHDAEPSVAWREVFADFTREWAGLEGGGLYRPLVSLTFGIAFAVFGSAPFWFHLLNVLLHAGAAFCCAIVCARSCPQRPALAAVVGGAVLALHPTVAEATCWISARTTALQLAFAMLALAGFATYLRSARRAALLVTLTGFLGALMSKENAVILPVSFFALDLLTRGGRRIRFGLHTVMVTVVLAYFAFRKLVLGAWIGGDGAGAQTIQSDDLLGTMIDKVLMLLYPVSRAASDSLGIAAGVAGALAASALILLGSAHPKQLRAGGALILGLLGLWILAHLAPTYKMPADRATLLGSRMVVGATTAWAIGLALFAARSSRPGFAWLVAIVFAGSLFTLGIARRNDFMRAYADMATFQSTLLQTAERATPEEPLGVVTVNRDLDGVPFLNCNATFPLLEKPYSTTDHPMVNFGFIFQPVPDAEHLLFDVGPLRAMREAGTTMLEWHRVATGDPLLVVDRRPDNPAPLPPLRKTGAALFLSPHAIDPRNGNNLCL